MSETEKEAERKAKAARAKKLLAQRRAKAAGAGSTSAAASVVSEVPSVRNSLTLDDTVREEVLASVQVDTKGSNLVQAGQEPGTEAKEEKDGEGTESKKGNDEESVKEAKEMKEAKEVKDAKKGTRGKQEKSEVTEAEEQQGEVVASDTAPAAEVVADEPPADVPREGSAPPAAQSEPSVEDQLPDAVTEIPVAGQNSTEEPAKTHTKQANGDTPNETTQSETSTPAPKEEAKSKKKKKGKKSNGTTTPTSLAEGPAKLHTQEELTDATAANALSTSARPPTSPSAASDTIPSHDTAPSSPVMSPRKDRVSDRTTADVEADAKSMSNLKETVSLLIAERTDLQAQVASLTTGLNAAKADSGLLTEGRALISRLEGEKEGLEKSLDETKERAGRVGGLETELRTQSEELGVLRKEKETLKDQLGKSKADGEEGKRVVEEKAAELEKSLERSREREGGLEAELGRLRSSNTDLQGKLKSVQDELDSVKKELEQTTSDMEKLRNQHDELSSGHTTVTKERDDLKTQQTTLTEKHDKLVTESKAASSAHQSLTAEIEQIRKEAEASTSKLEALTKRADSAEKKKMALQEDNAELVKQLEEVRGRVVQIMEEKVDLAGKVESLETKSKGWEREKEAQVEEISSLRSQVEVLADDYRASSSKVDELQTELESTRSTLEERNSALSTVEQQLKAAQGDQEEDHAVSTLKAAHDLELSQSSERIRSLQNSLHAAENRVHGLTRQLSDFQLNASPGPSRGYFLSDGDSPSARSPGQPSRPTGVDALLPAHVRHKRQVSLSALKARMEPSHRPVLSSMASVGEEGELSGGVTSPAGTTPFERTKRNGRAQFGDEIMYCCPACEGDLITL